MNAGKNSSYFEDLKVNVKIKLSALWAASTFCYLYGDYFELYLPKKVERLLVGENILDNPGKLFAAAVLMTIPATMVFLSIVLRPKINRILNIIFGLLFTTIMLLIAFTSLTPWRTFYVFLALVESILTALIVWYSWKWPKQKI
ncbi:MAG: hypothetical protein KIT66_06570 [Chitinophagaceae bacterium]|nr:hypothetical protein [Chitinophagaceae bacterium]MCZ2395501.1 DUF6326 family protein [Chitinophagales bacterium]